MGWGGREVQIVPPPLPSQTALAIALCRLLPQNGVLKLDVGGPFVWHPVDLDADPDSWSSLTQYSRAFSLVGTLRCRDGHYGSRLCASGFRGLGVEGLRV